MRRTIQMAILAIICIAVSTASAQAITAHKPNGAPAPKVQAAFDRSSIPLPDFYMEVSHCGSSCAVDSLMVLFAEWDASTATMPETQSLRESFTRIHKLPTRPWAKDYSTGACEPVDAPYLNCMTSHQQLYAEAASLCALTRPRQWGRFSVWGWRPTYVARPRQFAKFCGVLRTQLPRTY